MENFQVDRDFKQKQKEDQKKLAEMKAKASQKGPLGNNHRLTMQRIKTSSPDFNWFPHPAKT